MKEEVRIILKLVEKMKNLEASDGHFTMANVTHTKGITAVLSVYDNIKPAQMILEELYEWAEHNNKEVKELIDKLKEDMTWNEENPV